MICTLLLLTSQCNTYILRWKYGFIYYCKANSRSNKAVPIEVCGYIRRKVILMVVFPLW